MTKARNALLTPAGLLLVAGILLIVVLVRAQFAFAPVPTMHHTTRTGFGGAAPAAQTASSPAAGSVQTISSIGTSQPISAPRPATQLPITESKPPSGSAHCPVPPNSGLPCHIP